MSLALAIVSIGCGIPITAIADHAAPGSPGSSSRGPGIVLVNVLFARSR